MQETFVIYGIRPVLEAFASGKTIEKVLLQQGLRGEHIQQVLSLCQKHDIPFQHVPVQKLNRVTMKNHQGLVAFVSPVVFQALEELVQGVYESGKSPLILVLDRVTDVRNFGALCRTAEAAGVDVILLPSRGSAAIQEDAVKTSAGALLRVPISRSPNLKKSLQYLKDSGIRVLGISEKAEKLYYMEKMLVPTALLLGSEEDGISPAYLPYCDALVRIPMLGGIASLNVSVAGGIVMFEAVAQRLKSNP